MKLLILALIPLLSACNSLPNVTEMITPYRIDIRQGNYVSQDMVAKLKPGMTRDQVRYILGTPLVSDMFHADRWDYVYSFKPGHGDLQSRRLSVFFEDNKLARVAGDVEAGQQEDVRQAAEAKHRLVEIGDKTKKDGQ